MQAVLGAQVAQATGLRVGDRFAGVHGLGAGGHAHGDHPYVVTGVLAPSNSVLDRLVLTATESVWAVHETDMATDAEDLAALQAEREITLALIRYRTPLAAVTFPRHVNGATNMQAAAPAYELSRLLRMLGAGADVLRALGVVLVGVAALSVFMALWQAVRERRADLAMLQSAGPATPRWQRLGRELQLGRPGHRCGGPRQLRPAAVGRAGGVQRRPDGRAGQHDHRPAHLPGQRADHQDHGPGLQTLVNLR